MSRHRNRKETRNGTPATEIRDAESPATKDRLLNAVYRLAVRHWTPGFVAGTYSRFETAYWKTRLAMADETTSARVADRIVEFGVSTPAECRRATDLGGERAVIAALLAELDGAETVWDVGACVGTYACFVARALTTGRVVGFEPEPANRSRLGTNLEINASTERWAVSAVALWNENGTATLASESVEAGGGHHHLAPGASGTAEAFGAVETRRGDALVEEGFAPPDVLKIDVQGAELAVLEGLGDVLDTVASVYLEIHPEKCERYDTTVGAVEAFLREAGFSLTNLGVPANRRSGVYFLRASR